MFVSCSLLIIIFKGFDLVVGVGFVLVVFVLVGMGLLLSCVKLIVLFVLCVVLMCMLFSFSVLRWNMLLSGCMLVSVVCICLVVISGVFLVFIIFRLLRLVVLCMCSIGVLVFGFWNLIVRLVVSLFCGIVIGSGLGM